MVVRRAGKGNQVLCCNTVLAVFSIEVVVSLSKYALIAGGNWTNAANCGPRCRNCNNGRLDVNANNAARGRAPIRRMLEILSSCTVFLPKEQLRLDNITL